MWPLMLAAQPPAFLPLEVGNAWLYRQAATNSNLKDGQQFRSIWVQGKQTVAGREYFDVSYFGRSALLRVEPSDSSVFVYSQTSGSEQPWLSFGLPAGATFPTGIDLCSTTGTIVSRDASVATPAGGFANAVQFGFRGSCADAGLTRQFYAPQVGLVSSEETTIAGPLKFDLVYYRVGSNTAVSPETAFTVAIDSPRYAAGSMLNARLTLRNSGPQSITLQFPSGQTFDLKILDDKGNVMYQWSRGKAFTMVFRTETFGTGERTYGVAAPLTGLPAGRYTAEAYLTTSPLMYSGSVPFEIVATARPQAVRKRPVGGAPIRGK